MAQSEIQIRLEPTNARVTADELESSIVELRSELEAFSDHPIRIDEKKKKSEGTLGPEWLPVLVAVLAAPATTEAVKGLISIVTDWLKRRKAIRIILTGPNGEYVISSENVSELSAKEIAL